MKNQFGFVNATANWPYLVLKMCYTLVYLHQSLLARFFSFFFFTFVHKSDLVWSIDYSVQTKHNLRRSRRRKNQFVRWKPATTWIVNTSQMDGKMTTQFELHDNLYFYLLFFLYFPSTSCDYWLSIVYVDCARNYREKKRNTIYRLPGHIWSMVFELIFWFVDFCGGGHKCRGRRLTVRSM